MKKIQYRTAWVFAGGFLLLALLPSTISAQDPAPASAPMAEAIASQAGASPNGSVSKSDEQENQAPSEVPVTNQDAPHAPIAPASPLFRLGGNGLLGGTDSPLRLGPIYVSSAEIFGAFDRFSPSNGSPDITQNGALMRTSVVLEEIRKNMRFAAQWDPRLSIINGVTRGDTANGGAVLDATFNLSPRLSLNLSDQFSYFASRLLYGDFFVTSGVVQEPFNRPNSFLDAPGHALNNSAKALFNYRLSALTEIRFTTGVNYFRTNTTSLLLNSSREYAGSVALNHTISPKTNIGLYYNLSAVDFETQTTPVFYHSFGGSYAHLFSPTLSFTGTAGISTFGTPNEARSWTFSGSATLMKTFRENTLSINYLRSLYLDDYISTNYTDRIDGQYGRRVKQRLGFILGAGFQRESRTNGFLGRYLTSTVNYQLLPALSAYARYTYSYQRGDQQFLVAGNRNLFAFGLLWRANSQPAR